MISDLVSATREYLERKCRTPPFVKGGRGDFFTRIKTPRFASPLTKGGYKGFDFGDSLLGSGVWDFCDDVCDDVVGESAFFYFL